MPDDDALTITEEDIIGQQAAELDAAEGLDLPPAPTTAPPVPGQAAADEAQTTEQMFASMTMEEKLQLLKRVKAEKEAIESMVATLEEETQAADDTSFFEHALALCDELEEEIRPIRLGGDFKDEMAPHRKLEELRTWLTQGLTIILAEKVEESPES